MTITARPRVAPPAARATPVQPATVPSRGPRARRSSGPGTGRAGRATLVAEGAGEGVGEGPLRWAIADSGRTATRVVAIPHRSPDGTVETGAAAARHGRLLVLGSTAAPRGPDGWRRLLDARRPIVVVPETWTDDGTGRDTIVVLGPVGDVLSAAQRRSLTVGLVLAERLGARVRVVADWRSFVVGAPRDAALRRFRRREDAVGRVVAPYAAAHPRLRVTVAVPVRDARRWSGAWSRDAGLLVLPGASGPAADGGAPESSWTTDPRQWTVPVVVVP